MAPRANQDKDRYPNMPGTRYLPPHLGWEVPVHYFCSCCEVYGEAPSGVGLRCWHCGDGRHLEPWKLWVSLSAQRSAG